MKGAAAVLALALLLNGLAPGAATLSGLAPSGAALSGLAPSGAALSGGGAAPSGSVPASGDQERQSALTEVVLGLSQQVLALAQGEPAHSRATAVRPRGIWQWPLAGEPRVVKVFDPPDQPWLPGHRGIDLTGMATEPVLAVAEGTVTYSGSIAGIGIVSITHADGIRSTYQPVTDRIDRGEQVSAGDQIGLLGDFGSHCLLRTCLHLGAVRGKRDYLDPLLLLQAWQLTLLPHRGE